MITVLYNADPNEALDINHRASFSRCTVQEKRVFNTQSEAVRFWFECSSPITKIEHLVKCSKTVSNLYKGNSTEFDVSLVTDRVLHNAEETSDNYISNF